MVEVQKILVNKFVNILFGTVFHNQLLFMFVPGTWEEAHNYGKKIALVPTHTQTGDLTHKKQRHRDLIIYSYCTHSCVTLLPQPAGLGEDQVTWSPG